MAFRIVEGPHFRPNYDQCVGTVPRLAELFGYVRWFLGKDPYKGTKESVSDVWTLSVRSPWEPPESGIFVYYRIEGDTVILGSIRPRSEFVSDEPRIASY